MFKSKQQVDRHVSSVLSKHKDPKQRQGYGYQFAKLYFDVKDFQSAKRCIEGYLATKDNYSPAYLLKGEIMLALNDKESALAAYKKAYDLDNTQKNIVIKICDLYCDIGGNNGHLKVWLERCEVLFPKHPALLRLKEKICRANPDQNHQEDLESAILGQLKNNPNDCALNVKYLRHLIDQKTFSDAYKYCTDPATYVQFYDYPEWCTAVLEVLENIHKGSPMAVNEAFESHLLLTLNSIIRLSLATKGVKEIVLLLKKFDLALASVRAASKSLLLELKAQLFFYAAVLIQRKIEKGSLSYQESVGALYRCYMVSYSIPRFTPPSTDTLGGARRLQSTSIWDIVRGESAIRRSQCGHMARVLSVDVESTGRAGDVGVGGPTDVAKAVYDLESGQSGVVDSVLLAEGMHFSLGDPRQLLSPELVDLKKLDMEAISYKPRDLTHIIWILLHHDGILSKIDELPTSTRAIDLLPKILSRLFRNLPLASTENPSETEVTPESLCELDLFSFLTAVLRFVQMRHSESGVYQTSPLALALKVPRCLMEERLSPSCEQRQWWVVVNELLGLSQSGLCLGRNRGLLQQGLEQLRLRDQHWSTRMPSLLVLHTAWALSHYLAQSETDGAPAWPELFWRCGLETMERPPAGFPGPESLLTPQRKGARTPGGLALGSPAMGDRLGGSRILFSADDMTVFPNVEVWREESLIQRALGVGEKGDWEGAVRLLDGASSANAAYQQASLVASALSAGSCEGDEEMPCQLRRARDFLHKAMDRQATERDTGKKKELAESILQLLESTEGRLQDLIAKVPSSEDTKAWPYKPPNSVHTEVGNSSFMSHLNGDNPQSSISSPMSRCRPPTTSTRSPLKPTPERLDAQLRVLTTSQERIVTQLLDHNKTLMVSNAKLNQLIVDTNTKLAEVATELQESRRLNIQLRNEFKEMENKYKESFEQKLLQQQQQQQQLAAAAAAGTHPLYSLYPQYQQALQSLQVIQQQQVNAALAQQQKQLLQQQAGVPLTTGIVRPVQPGTVAGRIAPQPNKANARYAGRTSEDHEESYELFEDEYFYCDDEYDHGVVEDGAWPYGQQTTVKEPAGTQKPMPEPGFFQSAMQLRQASSSDPNIIGSQTMLKALEKKGESANAIQGAFAFGTPKTAALTTTTSTSSTTKETSQKFFMATSGGSSSGMQQTFGTTGTTSTPAGLQTKPFSFGAPSFPPTTKSSVGLEKPSLFKTPTSNVDGNVPTATTSASKTSPYAGIKFGAPAAVSSTATIPTVSQTSKPTTQQTPFTTSANLPTFGSLAQQQPQTGFTQPGASASTQFTGAGQTLFGNKEIVKKPDESPNKSADREGDPESFEPVVDFKPLIELPKLVTHTTGEEEETCHFVQQARLYRFAKALKQWKARGDGVLKILEHKKSGVCRLVMRRDQVLKLCANHNINSFTRLEPYPGSRNALMWAAKDFSDGELKDETFAVKFKTEEQMNEFNRVFLMCQEKMKNTEEKKTPPKAAPTTQTTSKSNEALKEKFKPKAGSWECTICLVRNDADKNECVACQTEKPGATVVKPAQASRPGTIAVDLSLKEKFKPKAGSWECSMCLVNNDASRTSCMACETSKSGTKGGGSNSILHSLLESQNPSESTVFNIGQPSKSSGITAPVQFGTGTSKPGGNGKMSFQFGQPSKASSTSEKIVFGAPKDSSVSTEKSHDRPAAPTILFGTSAAKNDPIAKTSNSESKPGSGVFSGLNFSSDKTSESKSGFLFGNTAAASTEKSTFKFSFSGSPEKAAHSSKEKPKTPIGSPGSESELYEDDDGEHIYFKPVLEKLPEKVAITTGEENEKALFSRRCKLFRWDNGAWKERGIGEIKVLHPISEDKSDRVRIVMRRDQVLKVCCNHYVGCGFKLKTMPGTQGKAWTWFALDFAESANEPQKELFAVRFKEIGFAEEFKNVIYEVVGTGEVSQSEESGQQGATENCVDDDVIFVKREPEVTEEQIQRARALQLPDLFYSYENIADHQDASSEDDEEEIKRAIEKARGKTCYIVTTTSDSKPFGLPKAASLFGQPSTDVKPSTTTPSFSFATAGLPSFSSMAASSSASDVNTSSVPVSASLFSTSGMVDFAALAKTSDSTAEIGNSGLGKSETQRPENFSWSGAGAKVFTSSRPRKEEDEDGSGEEDEGDSTDVHFEPAIELPELVQVQTGEEGETCLFRARCRLYRYGEGQWKERGIGEMKILKDNNSSAGRLVMRREQIHKLCCNHRITSTCPELKPMVTSTNSLCWLAQDFSDGEAKMEQFAIRFKTEVLLREFQEKVESLQKEMTHNVTRDTSATDESAIKVNVSHADTSSVIDQSTDDGARETGEVSTEENTTADDSTRDFEEVNNSHADTSSIVDQSTESAEETAEIPTTDNSTHEVAPAEDSAKDVKEVTSSNDDASSVVGSAEQTVEVSVEESHAANASHVIDNSEDSAQKITEGAPEEHAASDVSPQEVPQVVEDVSTVDIKVETEDEEEETEMFAKRVSLAWTVSGGNAEKTLDGTGLGELRIVEDDDVDGARIKMMTDGSFILVCNHIITKQTKMQPNQKTVLWVALDYSTDEPIRKQFSATFSSIPAVEEFMDVYQKAYQMAIESDLSETTPEPHEIDVPETVGGESISEEIILSSET